MPTRSLEYLPLDDLEGQPDNPKDHDLELLAASVARFGFTEPPLLDERTGRLIAGHGRLERLRANQDAGEAAPEGVDVGDGGRWFVPVVRGWSSANDDEAHAYLVASNQAVIAGGWVTDRLAPMLDDLRRSTEDGLAGVGFSNHDVDALLAATRATEPEPAKGAEPERQVQKRAKAGDLWTLGDHRLIVGDARDPAVHARLLDGAQVNVAFTSPPYADRRKYDAESGFKPIHPDTYVEWFAPVAMAVHEHLADDGSWFVNIKPGASGLDTELYVHDLVAAHVRLWGWHWLTELCWERVGVPKQVVHRFKNQYELIYQFVKGRPKVRPDGVRYLSDQAIIPFGPGRGNTSWADPDSAVVSQGQRGDLFEGQRLKRKNGDTTWGRPGPDGLIRQGSGRGAIPVDLEDPDVEVGTGWAYPGNRLPTFTGSHEATGHTAAYPVGLPAWFLRAYSDEGDTVLDPFVGSGSTLLAAEQEGRRGYAIELSPIYVDVILDRWERHGGATPTREARRRGRAT